MDNLELEAIQEIEVETTSETELDVDVVQAGPQGKDGLSAYNIYVKNGGILTEVEWLESLKGEKGETPVVGVDYWTESDKNDIKQYCDTYIVEQIGVIENGYY